ncbi:MAG: hypothetical protein HY717_03275, partial [Planctomycetes bacterium]|nr:hypothetical protein [Planctomycetota bacterium]
MSRHTLRVLITLDVVVLLFAVLASEAGADDESRARRYTTYLGGWGADRCNDAARDAQGNVYLVGSTGSPEWPGWGPLKLQGGNDALVIKLSPTLDEILALRTLGGLGDDIATSVDILEDVLSTDICPTNMHRGRDMLS